MAKFSVTLAVLCVFGAVLVKGYDKKDLMAKFMVKVDQCKSEVGAKDVDIEELLGKKPASSMEGKCLRACIMKKCKVMDSNGKFDKSVALDHAENYADGIADRMKSVNEMIDACSSIAISDDHCEAAEQYAKCFKDQADAHGMKDDFEI